MIAANIGAGSTVGSAGLAYRDGLSAWWWVGSAGLGSLVFAFWIAPRLWRIAAEHNFYTTGDYLEFRFGPAVRSVAALLVGLGTLALLAGQLIAGAAILNVLTGIPRWAGALAGGGIMTIYFTAGGLLGSAHVNVLQLAESGYEVLDQRQGNSATALQVNALAGVDKPRSGLGADCLWPRSRRPCFWLHHAVCLAALGLFNRRSLQPPASPRAPVQSRRQVGDP